MYSEDRNVMRLKLIKEMIHGPQTPKLVTKLTLASTRKKNKTNGFLG